MDDTLALVREALVDVPDGEFHGPFLAIERIRLEAKTERDYVERVLAAVSAVCPLGILPAGAEEEILDETPAFDESDEIRG